MLPIVKQTFHTHHLVYRWWCPCKIRWNNDKLQIQLKLAAPSWKLLPWNILTWFLIFGLGLGSVVFLLIREIFEPSPRLNAIHIAIFFCGGAATFLNWGVWLAFRGHWTEIVSAFNQLAIFEEDWQTNQEDSYKRPRRHYFHIWKLSREELTGMFLNIVIIATAVGVAPILTIIGIAANLDPAIPILDDYFLPLSAERSLGLNVLLFLSRLILLFIGFTEFFRFVFVELIFISSFGNVIEKKLDNILQIEDLDEAYNKFQLLWLQYHIIKTPINNALAIGTISGFFGGTTLI